MLKICVYAISLNEAKFIDRFYESARDADLVLLADTGSTDGTRERAQALGITTYDITVKPWRFDTARNIALGLIPADIDVCISLDIDEVLETGWRQEIERVWTEKTTRLQYRYDWGKDHIFNATKIHSRDGYIWQSICHEMIFPDPRHTEVWARTEQILIRHRPDDHKSRTNYLPQLHANTQEQPHNARNAYYYARELYFAGHYDNAITEFQRYLDLPDATWYHERSAAWRYIARCYDNIGNIDFAILAAEKAHYEAKNLREPLVLMAELHQKQANWPLVFDAATRALAIEANETNAGHFTNESRVWGFLPYDQAAIAAYYLRYKKEALEYGKRALELDPNNTRLQDNIKWYL